MSDLERALDDLEATLAAVYDQADADYQQRHYPWHEEGRACIGLDTHHHGRTRIWYHPEPVAVRRPKQEQP